ncbi:DEAD/DEAH box helicase [Sinomonas halotolerans]|uniref:DEAD/DEAH box helicase n=1 Tax=Sinomonas halotolerans TaxID=1644133 RepID=A0ABU9X0T6_9MICC
MASFQLPEPDDAGGGAPPLIDVGTVAARVGPAAIARGRTYARSGHVHYVEWDADSAVIAGEVQGSEVEPYRTEVYLRSGSSGYACTGSWCSCPIGEDCKHVAALVLASNEIAVAADVLGLRRATEIGPATNRRGAFSAQPVPVPAPAPEPAWKGELQRIIDPSTARNPLRGPGQRLGLQFELRDLDAELGKRFGGYPAARHRQGTKLGMRPVTHNPHTGNWVKGNLTWSTFGRQNIYGDFHQPHFDCFRELQALRLGTESGYWNGSDPWMYLDDYLSPLLWTLLEAAAQMEIGLVGARKGTEVALADGTATVTLDAHSAPDGDGGLRLSPVLAIGGVPVPATAAGTIGDHGAYAVVRENGTERILLAPAAARLTERERALLGTPAGIEIPGPDREAFLAEVYPDLARSVTLRAADDGVQLPPVAPPRLVLTAAFEPGDVLRLAWHWEYGAGDAARQLALVPVPGEATRRDERAEAEAKDRATALLADTPLRGKPLGPARLEDLDTADFAERVLPQLAALEGVDVRVEGTQPDYRRLEGSPQLVVSTVESEKRDWFDLGLMVTIGERTIPFQDIFTALARGRDKVLLPDKTWFRIDTPEIQRLRRLIDDSHELREWRAEGGAKKPPRLSVYQAGLWDEIAELAGETVQAPRWKEAVEGLLDPHALDRVPVPAGLAAELRPYQDEGFQWLAFLHRHGLGGVLADDMGLGKTLQTLALILHARDGAGQDSGSQGKTARDGAGRQDGAAGSGAARPAPFLVVAPTSVVPNWAAEAARFAPGVATVALTDTQGKSGTPIADAAAVADIVVTSYALFRLDFEAYDAVEWSGLIMDEAQFLKNRATKAHQCARDLATPFKLALTGTPLENNLMELWSLFAIVAPGLFPAAHHFSQEFAKPVEKNGDATRLARLRRRVRPLMLRRTKEAVATELPEKLEQRLDVELSPRHRKLYQQYLQRERQKVLGLVEDLDRNRFIVFRSLTLLRLMALDPALVDEAHDGVSPAKLDALLEQLGDVVAEGHRALVFSQFTSFLKKAAERLDAEGIAYEYLDGSTRRRGEVVSRFKEGHAPVFLISLKAGGFGLNLTEADYCFLLDPWWNPAAEAQAVDRAHRIGQTRKVMTYRLVASGTIEEKVMELKEKKAALFSSVMDDDAMFASSLTADDVRSLLE